MRCYICGSDDSFEGMCNDCFKAENPVLNEWSVGMVYDSYQAPELVSSCLSGKISNDSRFVEGHRVLTSGLVWLDINRGRAKTKSGTDYALNDPSKDWLTWLEENGHDLHQFNIDKRNYDA
jgi:hypothetical protein